MVRMMSIIVSSASESMSRSGVCKKGVVESNSINHFVITNEWNTFMLVDRNNRME